MCRLGGPHRIVPFLVAVAAVVGVPIRLDAVTEPADAKVYGGGLCVTDSWPGNIVRTMAGRLTSNVQNHVQCPIIADSEMNPSQGLDIVRVYIVEGNSTPHSTCRVSLISATTGLEMTGVTMPAITAAGNQTKAWSLPGTGPQYPRYLLQCTLSAGSSLNEYEIQEKATP